ncbi:MAG: 3-deoxy-D-manno-octulosonate 8-phosphate phosphatase [Holophagaceae bacterium]|nr:3-deoxy-D-manno-octulosonate 8-phosphate phosphatase [Holophagaceae bacterium]
MQSLLARARQIRLVCTDVDGVLTDGSLHFGLEIGHTKSFNVRDGAAIKWLQKCDIPVAFISGLDSPATLKRAEALQVVDCFAGHLAKLPILEQLCAKYGLRPDEVAHLGDDLPDLPILSRVGLACCPADAVPEVLETCHFVAPVSGGHGVFRSVAELILKAQGSWDRVVSSYRG